MSLLQQSSAPGKSKMDSAGEREFLIHALCLAVARSRLAVNALETIGVSLRHRQVTCDQAIEWLRDEGLIDHVHLGPPGASSA